jgi:signal peptidase I
MKRRERWIPVTLALGVLVLGTGAWFAWPIARHAFDSGRQLKAYSIPSESMRPTLEPGDRIYPRNIDAKGIMRGEVVVYRLGNKEVRVGRVAAIGGDRIALAGGLVSINGKPVPQRPAGEMVASSLSLGMAKRQIEQFPGEPQPHAILDEGVTPQDEYPAEVVPADHVFILGDNRDNSMDSRFSRVLPGDPTGMTVGMLPVGNVIGRVDFVAWSSKIPGRVDRPITKLDK